MASQSLPQKYRHSYTPQYLHPHYHPQIRRRKNATWDQRYRGCGSMWASESALSVKMKCETCFMQKQYDLLKQQLFSKIYLYSQKVSVTDY
ncbi:UNVERIFIED_CONTAM: hypothetical protein NCL1_12861 [Trichonephila clavipes]